MNNLPWMQRAPFAVQRAYNRQQPLMRKRTAIMQSTSERWRVLFHEFGHREVGRYYGWRTEDVALLPEELPNAAGIAEVEIPGDAFPQYVINVYAGGPLAEIRSGTAKAHPGWGEGDRRQASKHLGYEVSDYEWDVAWHESGRILEANWRDITALAEAAFHSRTNRWSSDECSDISMRAAIDRHGYV